jgi:hypothetical protein
MIGNPRDAFEQRPVHQGAGRVVGVGDGDELGARRDQPLQLVEVGQEALLGPQVQNRHVGAVAFGDGVVLLVGGQHAHHSVPGFDEGGVEQRVGANRPVRHQHVVHRLAGVQSGDGGAEPGRAFDGAVGELERQQPGNGLVRLAGQLEQLRHRE